MREQDLFELRRNIGMVFQESALFDSLNVEENVAYRLIEETGESHGRDSSRACWRRCGSLNWSTPSSCFPLSFPAACGVASASPAPSSPNPEVLLYDSPTGGLDPVTSNTIIELIVKQRDLYQTSSLMVTHRLQDAFTMASHYFDREQNKMVPIEAMACARR